MAIKWRSNLLDAIGRSSEENRTSKNSMIFEKLIVGVYCT